MPYATLDDNFAEHPKIFGLSDAAFRLHVSGILYCARHTTDGLIAAEKVPTLVPRFRRPILTELVDRGLWLDVMGRAWEIHDYLDWNLSRAEIESRRDQRRKSGKKGAQMRWDM